MLASNRAHAELVRGSLALLVNGYGNSNTRAIHARNFILTSQIDSFRFFFVLEKVLERQNISDPLCYSCLPHILYSCVSLSSQFWHSSLQNGNEYISFKTSFITCDNHIKIPYNRLNLDVFIFQWPSWWSERLSFNAGETPAFTNLQDKTTILHGHGRYDLRRGRSDVVRTFAEHGGVVRRVGADVEAQRTHGHVTKPRRRGRA